MRSRPVYIVVFLTTIACTGWPSTSTSDARLASEGRSYPFTLEQGPVRAPLGSGSRQLRRLMQGAKELPAIAFANCIEFRFDLSTSPSNRIGFDFSSVFCRPTNVAVEIHMRGARFCLAGTAKHLCIGDVDSLRRLTLRMRKPYIARESECLTGGSGCSAIEMRRGSTRTELRSINCPHVTTITSISRACRVSEVLVFRIPGRQ